jgi:hypothetical protein
MMWLMWRQHRAQWSIALALVAAFAVPVWITGSRLRSAIKDCAAGCPGDSIFHGYTAINTLVDITVVAPAVIGVFWGASVVAKELEFNTAALVWTQSMSRHRWIASKLIGLLVASAAASGAVTALVSWWSYTHNAVLESRFGGLQFDIQGVVPIGYTVFASALGFTAGVVWRRSLPAMATTLAGFIGARLVVELFARSHYRAPVTVLEALSKQQVVPQGALSISSDVMRNGQVIRGPISIPRSCGASRAVMDRCMARSGYQIRTIFQPAGRYWTFQWIEFGIFAVLAAAVAAVGVVALRRRDA